MKHDNLDQSTLRSDTTEQDNAHIQSTNEWSQTRGTRKN
jgi:hypothetical protein